MNIDKQIKDLAARYADCGITEVIIREMMDDKGNPSGMDDRAKLIGIRMSLGTEFNRQELFTLGDIAHITGESEEEAMKMMLDAGATPIEISVAPWLKGE